MGKKVQASYLSREETEILALDYALDLSDIYFLSGFIEEAREAYIDASYVAEGNGWTGKYNEIILKIENL